MRDSRSVRCHRSGLAQTRMMPSLPTPPAEGRKQFPLLKERKNKKDCENLLCHVGARAVSGACVFLAGAVSIVRCCEVISLAVPLGSNRLREGISPFLSYFLRRNLFLRETG